MRPLRRLIPLSDGQWQVSHSGPEPFVTSDRDLAERVREDMDRRDPLPCPHDNGAHDIVMWGQEIPIQTRCVDCGEPMEAS